MFKVGDVVRLRSGSPRMVVKEIGEDGKVDLAIFDRANRRLERPFRSDVAPTPRIAQALLFRPLLSRLLNLIRR